MAEEQKESEADALVVMQQMILTMMSQFQNNQAAVAAPAETVADDTETEESSEG